MVLENINGFSFDDGSSILYLESPANIFMAKIQQGLDIVVPEGVHSGVMITQIKPYLGGLSPRLYILRENGEDDGLENFVMNSVKDMALLEGVEWQDGVIVNPGLLLYDRYQRFKKATQSPIIFKEYARKNDRRADIYWQFDDGKSIDDGLRGKSGTIRKKRSAILTHLKPSAVKYVEAHNGEQTEAIYRSWVESIRPPKGPFQEGVHYPTCTAWRNWVSHS